MAYFKTDEGYINLDHVLEIRLCTETYDRLTMYNILFKCVGEEYELAYTIDRKQLDELLKLLSTYEHKG